MARLNGVALGASIGELAPFDPSSSADWLTADEFSLGSPELGLRVECGEGVADEF